MRQRRERFRVRCDGNLDHIENTVAVEGEEQHEGEDDADKRPDERLLRTDLEIDPAANESTEGGKERHPDAVDRHLHRTPAEDRRSENAAKDEDRRHAVIEDHARDEIEADIAEMADGTDRAPETANACLRRFAPPEAARLLVRHEEEKRQHEDDEPCARDGADDAVGLMGFLREAEKRLVGNERRLHLAGQLQQEQHENERDDRRKLADADADTGQKADPPVRRDGRQHGVREDDGELHADGGDDERDGDGKQRLARHGKPEAETTRRAEQHGKDDPGLPPARRIGHGAEKRAHQGDGNTRDGLHIAPIGLALHRILGEDAGEEGGKKKDGDEREIGLVRPFVENPRALRDVRGGLLAAGIVGRLQLRNRPFDYNAHSAASARSSFTSRISASPIPSKTKTEAKPTRWLWKVAVAIPTRAGPRKAVAVPESA